MTIKQKLRHVFTLYSFRITAGLGIGFFLLLFASYGITHTLMTALQIEEETGANILVFLFSLLLALLLVFLVWRIFILIKERKNNILGSRIRIRLSFFFVLSSLLPLLLFSVFAYLVFMSGIDTFYNPQIENALDLSFQYVQESRDALLNEFTVFVSRYFQNRAGLFDEREKKSGLFHFDQIGRYDLEGAYVPDGLKRRLAAAAEDRGVVSEQSGSLLHLVYFNATGEDKVHGGTYTSQPGMATGEVRVHGRFAEYASLALNPTLGLGAEKISLALAEYRQLRLMRRPLVVTLLYFAVLIVLLVTLLAILFAVRFARIITGPVQALLEGTRKIAQGELGHRVDAPGFGEFAQLLDNFNAMSEELSQSRLRLFHAERLAAWQEVAQRLAHEIKNPLTPIQLGAERILRQVQKENTEIRQVLEKVLPAVISEVKVIENLIDEFSAFARLPAKHVTHVEVGSFLEEVIETLKSAREDIQFISAVDAEIGSVRFDRDQMRRVMINLVQNAANAIAKTARAGVITLRAVKKEKGSIVFEIQDNGCGIPSHVGDDIFAPYYSDTGGGTGLGLSIVEKIVYDHGGRIWFESSPEGTSFYVRIDEAASAEDLE